MPTSSFRLATPEDDPALRRLLRENPMPGSLALSYEREPNYFIAARMEGRFSQTLVNVEDATGAFLGMGSRVIRPMTLNGQVRELGYMGHLRVDQKRPWGMGLAQEVARSFRAYHELHQDGRVPFYLMSVISDNLAAIRLLTSGLPGMPHTVKYARMYTYIIAPRHRKPEIRLREGLRLLRGNRDLVPGIMDCLQRNAVLKQFSPYWSSEDLFTSEATPGLQPEDFFVISNDGRVAGCLALWNQTGYKQMVVRGYGGNLARWRWAVNLLAKVVDVPSLPQVGSPVQSCFASHLAIDDNDRPVFSALLRAVYNETIQRKMNYFTIGISAADPLRKLLTKSYLHITYPSQLYLVGWDEGLEAIRQVDGRIPGIEIAIL